jgi:hypothetical protein
MKWDTFGHINFLIYVNVFLIILPSKQIRVFHLSKSRHESGQILENFTYQMRTYRKR